MDKIAEFFSGNLNLTWIDGLIVAAICAFDEWIIKKLIFKGDEKYKTIYTFAPIVLGAIVYFVMALIAKTPALTGLLNGIAIGLASMGSYDVIIRIIKGKGVSSVKEIGTEIADEVGKKK